MVFFDRKDEVLKEFQEWGWDVRGSLEDVLELEKFPLDSRLKAMLSVKRLNDGNYLTVGGLYSDEKDGLIVQNVNEKNGLPIAEYDSKERKILEVSYIAKKNNVITRLGEVICNIIEPYFGITNHSPFIDVYNENITT